MYNTPTVTSSSLNLERPKQMDPQVEAQLRAEAEKNKAAMEASGGNAAPSVTIPADQAMFLQMFPVILAGCLQKSGNVNDAISSAMEGTRAALGQYVVMGLLYPSTRLPDGTALARMPNQPFGGMGQGVAAPINGGGGMVQPGNYVGQQPTVQMQPTKTY